MSGKLKYVAVYDRIFQRLQNGTYPPGARLPSEKDLAEEMGVSRMTLRKALALLQEDGLILNRSGLGSFVIDESTRPRPPEKDRLENPMVRCCMEVPDRTELEFRIEPPSGPISKVLEQQTAAVVITDRWFKHGDQLCGYTLSFIPIEVISREKIDLNDPESLKAYLNTEVYRSCAGIHCICQHSTAGNFTSDKYALSEKSSFILIQENVFGEDRQILVSSKHYLPVELFRLELEAGKKNGTP